MISAPNNHTKKKSSMGPASRWFSKHKWRYLKCAYLNSYREKQPGVRNLSGKWRNMNTKNIGAIYPKKYNLSKALCQDNFDVQHTEYTDHYIDGVTYRVWSAFEGSTGAAESLENLMLRRLESGEKIEKVVDELEEFIRQKNNELLVLNSKK